MWKLVIEDDEGKRTVVPLTRDDYTVGRKEGNTIRLTERNVSREHAKIRKSANGASTNGAAANGGSPFVLEDLTSYNGVYVNGLRVAQPQGLQHGDLIQIGDYRIVIQDDAAVEDASAMATTTQDMKSTMPTGANQRGAQLMERPNRFVMLAGPTPGAEYSLDQERVTIGRAEDCTISINHNSVSRLHCEVHALGDGRFEIIDKGSSNGVRVNGSDLRRGIVEPGDILELGDVRFRFVGAGQIFIPAPGDATTQLETIGDRPASAPRSERGGRPQGGGSVVPWVLVGALFAVILVGGFAYWQRSQSQPNTVPSATTTGAQPEDKEQLALQAAKKLCETGDCEAAHDKLVVSIADHSPLQQSPDYQNIETRWADILLDRADKEKDVAKKRALYHQVEATSTVPQSRRDIATAKLQEIDAQGGTHLNQLPTATASAPTGTATGTATTHPSGTATGTATTHPTGTATTTATATTTTTATATTKPSGGGSVAEQARGMMLNNNPSGARSILEPRVFAKKATPEEAGLLWDACKAMRDKQCRDTVDQLYPGNPHH